MKRYRLRPSRVASAIVVVLAAIMVVFGTDAIVKRGGEFPWVWIIVVAAIGSYHLANLCGVLPSRLLYSPKFLGYDVEEVGGDDEAP